MSQARQFGVPTFGPSDPVTHFTRAQESFHALLSHNSGVAAPWYKVLGTTWLDTTKVPHLFKIYDGGSWITLARIDPSTHAVEFVEHGFQNVPSGTVVDLGATTGLYITITGRSSIRTLGRATAGIKKRVKFADVLTLLHNPNFFILPDSQNIRTAAGDFMEVLSLGDGKWLCVEFVRAANATSAEFLANTAKKALSPQSVWASAEEFDLPDRQPIIVDMSRFINATVILRGNRALGNPIRAKPGQSGRIRVVQDAVGGRTLSFGSYYKFGSSGAPALTGAAHADDILYYDVIAPNRIEIYGQYNRGN